ncbi:GD17792 [Drosophila simulans]|uniref:GD17792 n=1 Tax=Drosophila simulans TaxID=7240 RepID=B4QU84_DROSI|nr:GD17792 [Drosophila simulans]
MLPEGQKGPKAANSQELAKTGEGQGQDGIGWGRLCLACIQHTILGIPGSCSCSFCCCCF